MWCVTSTPISFSYGEVSGDLPDVPWVQGSPASAGRWGWEDKEDPTKVLRMKMVRGYLANRGAKEAFVIGNHKEGSYNFHSYAKTSKGILLIYCYASWAKNFPTIELEHTNWAPNSIGSNQPNATLLKLREWGDFSDL